MQVLYQEKRRKSSPVSLPHTNQQSFVSKHIFLKTVKHHYNFDLSCLKNKIPHIPEKDLQFYTKSLYISENRCNKFVQNFS